MRIINLNGKMKIQIVGNEKTPIIVIDDFSPELQKCIDLAVLEKFEPNKEADVYYPGVRAMIGGEYGNIVLRAVADVIRSVYAIPHPNTLVPHAGYYSLINLLNLI